MKVAILQSGDGAYLPNKKDVRTISAIKEEVGWAFSQTIKIAFKSGRVLLIFSTRSRYRFEN